MSTEIIVALVTSIFTLAGVIITVVWGNKLTEFRIKKLEEKQDKHNSLIERMYNAEDRLNLLDERTSSNTQRIENLEHKDQQ